MEHRIAPHAQTHVTERVRHYLDVSVSDNTRKAYRSDLNHFTAWGGTIPCSAETLAAYLSAHASVFACATLARRVATISKAHTLAGHPSPATHDAVRMVMRGIRREHGKPQTQATPLLKEDLTVVLSTIPDDLRGIRDKALLLLGFCAALRRSELCRVCVEDLRFTAEGMILTLPRSKTDQTGEGRTIGIPHGRGRICAVQCLKNWLLASGITSGPLFRSIEYNAVTATHLCDKSIDNIIKLRTRNAGLTAQGFSGHSLRSGLATSAAAHGMSSWSIRRQTGHKSDAMLARYIRNGSLFHDNAAGVV